MLPKELRTRIQGRIKEKGEVGRQLLRASRKQPWRKPSMQYFHYLHVLANDLIASTIGESSKCKPLLALERPAMALWLSSTLPSER